MIEWRWNLRALTVRDSTARNLAEVLDFAHPNLTAPTFAVPTGPFGELCLSTATAEDPEFPLDFAAQLGFPVGL
jgi:phospholipase C